MTEYVKIKCDDCKYREECVDYGWQGCRKFTPKPTEPMTNEEWFCSLSTEEKAKWLYYQSNGETKEDWEWWLKEIHK